MVDELLSAAIFKNINRDAMDDISDFCELIELDDGDALISENQNDSDLYVLWEGKLEVVSSGTEKTSGEIVISKQDYNIFGEITWLTHKRRTATLRCIGSVNAIKIDGEMLSDYLEENPEIGFQVMKNTAKVLAERLENTNTLIKQILWNSNL